MKLSSNNWRQIAKFDQFDACLILNGVSHLPFLEGYADLVKKLINETASKAVPKKLKCPFPPGKYHLTNLTFHLDTEKKLLTETVSPQLIPNGIYRNAVRTSFPGDPGGFYGVNQIEFREPGNYDQF